MSSQTTTMQAPLYPLNVGEPGVEEKRLNHQHSHVLLPVTETLLPEHVLKHLLNLGRAPALADIATGTGIWLEDLAPQLPKDSRLDGYDYDTVKFPEPSALPANIKLAFSDFSKPFPEDIQGQYDCVHVRLLMYALKTDEWSKLAENLFTLLRPGGWLVWDEFGYHSWESRPMTDNFKKWKDLELAHSIAVGRDVTTPTRLLEQVKEKGYVNCTEQRFSSWDKSKEVQRLAGRNLVNAGSQSQYGMVKEGGYDWIQTNEDVEKMAKLLYDDIENGVNTIGFVIFWVCGQRPEN